jgi:hypothetical protein
MLSSDFCVPTSGIEVTEIVTDEERLSYTLGVRAAKSLGTTPFPVNIGLFLEGVVDTVNGRPIIE